MPATVALQPFNLVFPSRLGWMGFSATARGIRRLTFGHTSQAEVQSALEPASAEPHSLPPWALEAQKLLQQYAAGEPVDLGSIPLDLPAGTPFEQAVRRALARIRYGSTISYGELAAAARSPGAARAVGNLMARNPVPLLIACHRVVGAGGRLGGYSAPSGLGMKADLLKMEELGCL